MNVFLYAYYTLVKKKKTKSSYDTYSSLTSCMIFSSLILEFHAGKMGSESSIYFMEL